jgi:FSR family fosmidomycin resistance protein-like MFS transporter
MEYKKLSLKNISANLLVYGTTHAVVDGVCAAVIFSILRNQIDSTIDFISLIILYNILAFGLQIIFGFVADYFKSPRAVALLGCVLTGISAVTFLTFPIMAIIFAGLGNALFHVGGGSVSLNLTPKKATAPGIYVAPGALGLLVGTMLGKSGQFIAWPFVLILAVLCIFMFIIKKPEMNYKREEIIKKELNYFGLILLLVFLSIAVRSLVGSVLVFPWKTNFDLLIVLTGAVVLGKGLGGILADKFGWIKIAVGSLILSIPFLVFGANIPILAIVGMFLFNITMPITLVAISNIFPGRPGFAFGITCLALIIGAFPAFFSVKQVLANNWFVFGIIIISASALYYALKIYYKNYPQKKLVD